MRDGPRGGRAPPGGGLRRRALDARRAARRRPTSVACLPGGGHGVPLPHGGPILSRFGGHRLERGPEVPEGLPSERPGRGPTGGGRDHARRVGVAGRPMTHVASTGPRAHARRAAEGRGGVAACHGRRREVGPPRAGRCVPSRRRTRRLPPPCRRARGAVPRGLPPRASRLRGLRDSQRPRRPRYRRIGHGPVEGTQGQGRPRGRRPDGPLPGVPRLAAGVAGPSPGPAPPPAARSAGPGTPRSARTSRWRATCGSGP